MVKLGRKEIGDEWEEMESKVKEAIRVKEGMSRGDREERWNGMVVAYGMYREKERDEKRVKRMEENGREWWGIQESKERIQDIM